MKTVTENTNKWQTGLKGLHRLYRYNPGIRSIQSIRSRDKIKPTKTILGSFRFNRFNPRILSIQSIQSRDLVNSIDTIPGSRRFNRYNPGILSIQSIRSQDKIRSSHIIPGPYRHILNDPGIKITSIYRPIIAQKKFFSGIQMIESKLSPPWVLN